MTNELAAKVAKVKELDAKRLKEAARLHKNRIKALDGYEFDTSKYITLKPIKPADAALAHHAPQMASIITEQAAIIQQQRAVMQQIRDGLKHCRPDHVVMPLIAAIDKAFDGGK